MSARMTLFLVIALACCLTSSLVQAEPKAIVAEGVYVMGDGETPNFGETMALQKAKQSALEQAGTYVQSYTQTKGMDISIDEIRTVAGGVLQTDVLAKTRMLLKDGGERFITKIRAIVSIDRIDELAHRIKGSSAAVENREVLEKYQKIEEALLNLQREMRQSKSDAARENAIEKIRDVEKQFRQVRSVEASLFKQILSGSDLLSQANKALSDQYKRKETARQHREIQHHSLKHVLDSLGGDGFGVEIGSPDVLAELEAPDMVTLSFPVTVVITDRLRELVKDLKKAHGGDIPSEDEEQIEEILDNVSVTVRVLLKGGGAVSSESHQIRFKALRSYDLGHVLVNQTFYSRVGVPRQDIEKVDSAEGHVTVGVRNTH